MLACAAADRATFTWRSCYEQLHPDAQSCRACLHFTWLATKRAEAYPIWDTLHMQCCLFHHAAAEDLDAQAVGVRCCLAVQVPPKLSLAGAALICSCTLILSLAEHRMQSKWLEDMKAKGYTTFADITHAIVPLASDVAHSAAMHIHAAADLVREAHWPQLPGCRGSGYVQLVERQSGDNSAQGTHAAS